MNERPIYTVRSSDTLWGIARDKLGDANMYREIKEWNHLPGFVIKPGQKLKLYNPNKGEDGK